MKPYQCIHESCEKRFARQDNMMQHYRVHEKKEKEKQKYKEKYRDCPDACSQKGKFDSRDAAVGFWRMARSTVSDISPSGADGNA
ncbi:hypothetical protein HDU83_005058 [Entophlyctis luteolus]|nr:hypothetical protein HDU83_005058 [Entophlyctis luteolus]